MVCARPTIGQPTGWLVDSSLRCVIAMARAVSTCASSAWSAQKRREESYFTRVYLTLHYVLHYKGSLLETEEEEGYGQETAAVQGGHQACHAYEAACTCGHHDGQTAPAAAERR